MTEISSFPLPSPARGGAEAYRRLAAILVEAASAGADLGPRGHQIDLLREAIQSGLRELVEAFVPVLDALSADDPDRRVLVAIIERFVVCIRAVLGAADRLSATATA
ncbi:hypothetical protein SAMN04487843_103266 [Methylobacterium sp. ap11]|uniref:hypothetical protein n=1 Tax=Methylobacterium sp. ap11 TaxID=1761799 RepID=UPI0008B5A7E9|nr:hypothetical protein [Methylobacterium sp. ap11]SEO73560.1 hypothetical protein SAMN04487843_103266 [Methylobacterium sp. ap11]